MALLHLSWREKQGGGICCRLLWMPSFTGFTQTSWSCVQNGSDERWRMEEKWSERWAIHTEPASPVGTPEPSWQPHFAWQKENNVASWQCRCPCWHKGEPLSPASGDEECIDGSYTTHLLSLPALTLTPALPNWDLITLVIIILMLRSVNHCVQEAEEEI